MVKGSVQIMDFEENRTRRVGWEMVGRDQLSVVNLDVSNLSQVEGGFGVAVWIVEIP